MKNISLTAALAAALLIAGCAKSDSSSSGTSGTSTQTSAPAAGTPVSQPAMTAWQQGDKATAISSFAATDWTAHPLFPAGSALSMSEGQLAALSIADRQIKGNELNTQLAGLKQLAAAVLQAGRDAAGKGDAAGATADFAALKAFGSAIDTQDYSGLVRLVGQSFKKAADAELAKVPH